MSVAGVDQFADRLDALDVELHRCSLSRASDVLSEVVAPPAVGIPTDDDSVEYPKMVTTDPTTAELRAAHTGVTGASLGVAEYGSVFIPTDREGTELVSLFVDRHVVLLHEKNLVSDMRSAIEWLGPQTRSEDQSVVVATGPSATADMGSLVKGAHGPKEVTVLLLTEDNNE